jgi:Cu/Ag efflux protein CusF
MKTVAAIALALALSLTCTRLAVADDKAAPLSSANLQSSVSQDDELHFETVLTVHGEIVSVDQTNRSLTLKRERAGTLTLQARNEKNLEGIKTGDRVVIRYVEGVHIAKKKAGEALPVASLKGGIIASKPGEPATAGVSGQRKTVARVEAIDEANQEVTLQGPEGSVETVMVENPEALERIKVGDQIVVTHGLALALSLDKES